MSKPYWLKTSYIKYKMCFMVFSLFSIFIKKNTKGEEKILVTELDGLGDVVLRQKLLELISKKYSKKNVYILIKNAEEILKMDGYNYFIYEKGTQNCLFKLMKLYKKLVSYNFTTLYSLEFKCDPEINFLKKLNFKKVYAYEGEVFKSWEEICEIHFISKVGEKILDVIYNYARVIDKNIKKDDVIPKLSNTCKQTKGSFISIGIGAGADNRVISSKKMIEFLRHIITKDPKVVIHLLGNGKNQEIYASKLVKELGDRNIINKVSKLSLEEVINEIISSKLYIGFDSGLYNIAYAAGIDVIAIVDENLSPATHHRSEKIKFLVKEDHKLDSRELSDPVYNNKNLNSISLETFIKIYGSSVY